MSDKIIIGYKLFRNVNTNIGNGCTWQADVSITVNNRIGLRSP